MGGENWEIELTLERKLGCGMLPGNDLGEGRAILGSGAGSKDPSEPRGRPKRLGQKKMA